MLCLVISHNLEEKQTFKTSSEEAHSRLCCARAEARSLRIDHAASSRRRWTIKQLGAAIFSSARLFGFVGRFLSNVPLASNKVVDFRGIMCSCLVCSPRRRFVSGYLGGRKHMVAWSKWTEWLSSVWEIIWTWSRVWRWKNRKNTCSSSTRSCLNWPD